jgi:phytoene desaturase
MPKGTLMAKRVLIIGAGPGGLAAAMLLARSGVQVTVLERSSTVGGRTSSIKGGGFTFDLGPTFFLYPRVLDEIFKAVGRHLHDEVELVRLDPQYRLIFGGGGELLATPNVKRMEHAIGALSPPDAASFRSFLADNRRKLADFKTCLETPFHGWSDVLRWRMLKLLPLLRPWLSLDQELVRYFRDPRVRLAFSFQSKYLGMSPFRCPSLFSILSYLEYEYGVHHPIGGCGAVTQAMARIVTELGGEFRLGESVKEVLFDRRRAVGVRTSAGCYKADAVIVNADFAHAMTRMIPNHLRRRWTDRKIACKRYSCSTFMMYLGIEGRFDHLEHHTIYMAKDYARNLEDIEKRHGLSDDPSFYVQNACVTDPTLAPGGMSTLYVLVPVTHQHPNVDWDRERGRFRDLVLRQLRQVGINDVEKRIRFERVITPADWEHQHQIYRGATFSLAHNLGQMLHLRPRNRFEDLEGVYLVGGGTHPGSGLPVIFESARITSRLLLEDFGVSASLPERPTSEVAAPALAAIPAN